LDKPEHFSIKVIKEFIVKTIADRFLKLIFYREFRIVNCDFAVKDWRRNWLWQFKVFAID